MPTCLINLVTPICRWGGYRLERLVASGVADSVDGIALEELSLAVGPARAVLKGSLLCARQEASLTVTDFPLELLQPLTTALPPALQVGHLRCLQLTVPCLGKLIAVLLSESPPSMWLYL
jgi:hypothetical protein